MRHLLGIQLQRRFLGRTMNPLVGHFSQPPAGRLDDRWIGTGDRPADSFRYNKTGVPLCLWFGAVGFGRTMVGSHSALRRLRIACCRSDGRLPNASRRLSCCHKDKSQRHPKMLERFDMLADRRFEVLSHCKVDVLSASTFLDRLTKTCWYRIGMIR